MRQPKLFAITIGYGPESVFFMRMKRNRTEVVENRSFAAWRVRIFPLLCIALILSIGISDHASLTGRQSVIRTVAGSLSRGEIGTGRGLSIAVPVSFDGLQPGDIILGGWPDCAYGIYSHAGLYIGRRQVLEAYADRGVCIEPVEHYLKYSTVCLLHVHASPRVKRKAVGYALKEKGKLFYPMAFKEDSNYWNCTKIIWQPYRQVGIDLDQNRDLWITPDALQKSRYTTVIWMGGR